jgi:hypothetical protein
VRRELQLAVSSGQSKINVRLSLSKRSITY